MFGDVVDGDHRGMPHSGGRARLALHAHSQVADLFGRGVGEGAKFLEGDLAAEDLVGSLPDHAHATAAEPPGDAVPSGQQPAGPVRAVVPLPRCLHRSPSFECTVMGAP